MANESAWKDLGPAAEAAWARYPVEYDAPEWQNLARAMAKRHGVPEDIVLGVLLRGEATNADKVSSTGARGPFQFVPGTRAKFIENKGIDPWLSPENNAEAAVLHLKESLERNKDRPEFDRKYLAVAEYIGGPDWMMPRDVKLKGGGVYKYRPKEATDYTDRVFEIAPSKRGSSQKQEQSPALVAGPTPEAMAGAAGEPEIPLMDEERRLEDVRSQFRQFTEQGAASGDKEFKAYALYAKGQMTPEVRQQYEEGVQSGAIKLPSGVKELKFGLAAKQEGKRGAIDAGPRTMLRYQAALDNDPYVSDRFTDEEMMRFEDQVRRGLVKVPDGFPLRKTAEPGFIDKIIESASGKKRATAETTTAKDWWDLPEIDADRIGYIAKMALIGASPDEAVNMIRSLAPQVKIDTDQRGNVIFESAADPGGKYAIKPGWEPSDTARLAARMVVAAPAAVIGAAAAPAVGLGGLVGLAAGGAAGAGLEEAAFQAAQGATPGGEFNASDVAISAALGGAVPAVGVPAGRAIGAVAQRAAALPVVAPAVGAVRRAAGTAEQAVRGAGVAATEAVAERVRPMALAAQMAQAAPTPVPRPPVAVVSRMEQATAPMVEQRLSAMRAAPPGMGAARALPPAPEAADFREAMMRFRHVQAEMPPKLPNPGRLTSVQADEILPLMQRYRDAAEAAGSTQSVRMADEYLARARASMAQPAAVARAQAAPLAAESRVFARAKVEPLKQAIKQAAQPPEPPKFVEDAVERAVAKADAPLVVDEILPAPTAISHQGLDATSDDLRRLLARASGAGALGRGSKKAQVELAQALNIDQASVEAAARLGVLEHMPPDYFSTETALRQLFQAVRSVRGKAGAAVKDAAQSIIRGVESYYGKLGAKADIKAFSDDVRSGMTSQREKLVKVEDDLWNELRSSIPGGTPIKPTATLGLIKDRLSSRNLSSETLKPAEKQIIRTLSGKKITYDILNDIKKNIGTKTVGSVWADSDEALNKLYYSKILEDQGALAEKFGAADVFDAARAATRARKALEDDMRILFAQKMDNELIGPLTGATKALETGQADNFASIVRAVPKEYRKDFIATGIVSTFGNVKNDAVKITNFIKWYDGIKKNQKAMATMLGSLDEADRAALKNGLEDTYKVFSAYNNAANQVVNTGLMGSIEKALEAVMQPQGIVGRIMLYSMQGAYQVFSGALQARFGVGGSVANSIMRGITGMRQSVLSKADDLIADPAFTKLAFEQASGTVKQETIKQVARSSRFRKYASAVMDRPMTDVTELERFLMSMLPVRGTTLNQERPGGRK